MLRPSALPPLSRLYREHFDAVWATLRRLGVPDASLEDAVHDVFVVVHRQREGFEGRSTARTWILGIARRVAFRHRRTHARTQRRHLALASVIPPVPDPDDDIARQEGWRALQGFLDELDEDKRAAFVLGEIERLNRQELGVALGVSPNTAWSRLRAARARFHTRFAAHGSAPGLAAGGRVEPAPAETRERVWLVLAGGLREAVAPAAAVGSVWSTKAVLVTVGLAAAVLGAVAVIAPGSRGGEPASVARRATEPHGDVGPERGTRSGRSKADAAVTTTDSNAPADPLIETSVEAGAASPTTATTSTTARPTTPASRAKRTPLDPPSRGSAIAPDDVLVAPADALAAETTLMLTARTALEGGRPGEALAALDEHRRRFPRGVLIEERDAMRARAHCALGQHDAARREALALVTAYPGSAYLDAIEAACPTSVTNPTRAGDQPR